VFFLINLQASFFRDSNRDTVLEHVKIHYRSTDAQNDHKDLTTEEIETHYRNTSTTITPVKHMEPVQTNTVPQTSVTVTSLMPNVNTSMASAISGIGLRAALNGGMQIGPNAGASVSSSTAINRNNLGLNPGASINSNVGGNGSGVPKIGLLNGEMDESRPKTIGTNLKTGVAPYKCGHCHQQSNWKHVIQVLTNPLSAAEYYSFYVVN
jgi:hypothetical protein